MADHKATPVIAHREDQPGPARPTTCSICGHRIQEVCKPRGERSQAEQRVFMADPANWYWKHTDPRSRM